NTCCQLPTRRAIYDVAI
ncbi:hypothetical protein A2U01_0105440, partial [Trifolium medium]|nr:hypothetical protein [Trifolium medium]